MPAPTNISAATATDLGTLPVYPASVIHTQDVHFAGTTYTVWVQFTVPLGVQVVGVRGWGDPTTYIPRTTVYIPDGAGGTISIPGTGNNKPFYFPVTTGGGWPVTGNSGGVYLLQIIKTAFGSTSPALLTLEIQVAPNLVVPVGSYFIPSGNEDGIPGVFLSAVDGSVLRYLPFPGGDAGDILANGTVLVDNIAAHLELFSASYVHMASINTGALGVSLPIRANPSGTTFYAAYKGGTLPTFPAKVQSVSSTGVIGPTTWTLTGNTLVYAIAVSPADDILYFLSRGTAQPVKRWDLIGNVALSDFLPGVGGQVSGGLDTIAANDYLLTLQDGTVLVAYHTTGPHSAFINHYSAAGALLNALSFGTAEIDRLAPYLPNPAYFLAWNWPAGTSGAGGSGIDTFSVVDSATMTVVSSVTNPQFYAEEFSGPASSTAPLFGHHPSCPLLTTTQVLTPPTTSPTPLLTPPVPCCATPCHCPPGSGGGGSGVGAPGGPASVSGSGPTGVTGPVPIAHGWTAQCAGGGDVPVAADLTDSENWAA